MVPMVTSVPNFVMYNRVSNMCQDTIMSRSMMHQT